MDKVFLVLAILCFLTGNGPATLLFAVLYLWQICKDKREQDKMEQKESKSELSGIQGEKRVSTILQNIAKENNFVIMNDVYLPLYKGSTQIDHLIFGNFGILVIETKNHRGKIVGSVEDEYWAQKLGYRSYRFYNPLFQNQTHINAVSYLLKKENLAHVPVYGVVVFSHPNAYIDLQESHVPVITADFLETYLNNDRFKKHICHMYEPMRVINQYKIKDYKIKGKHIQYVRSRRR